MSTKWKIYLKNSGCGVFPSKSAAVAEANTPQTISITVGNTVSANIEILANLYEVSGATAVDVSTHGTTSNSTALNATFSTTTASDFAFASLSNNTGGTYTQNNGWTQDQTDTGNAAYTFYNVLSSPGANSLNATVSAASYSLWNVVTFKGSGGAALAGAASDTTSATGSLANTSPPFVPILLDNPAHIGGSDKISMGTGPGTGTGDTAPVAFTKLKQWAVDLNTAEALLFPVRSLQTPTTGFTIVAGASVTQMILNPAGTLSTGTSCCPRGLGIISRSYWWPLRRSRPSPSTRWTDDAQRRADHACREYEREVEISDRAECLAARIGQDSMKQISGEPVTDEEFATAQTIKFGSVDDEIRLARILLCRALRAEREDRIDELLGRIEALELTRLWLRMSSRLALQYQFLNVKKEQTHAWIQ
jgi:hypothetical protein